MGLKGVVFDFNGTLFWDTDIHNKAWDIFLEKNNIRLSDKEKNIKIHGKNNKDILNNLFADQLSNEEVNRLSTEKEKIYQQLCLQSDMHLAPGAKEFLSFLSDINIPFTIATASELYNVDFYFEHLKLNSFFDRSKVIFNDGSIKSKPDPQIFQTAINILGLKECETLVFEDSISGIIAAENAKVAKIIIVNSNDDDYSRWDYQKIKNFKEVDLNLFNNPKKLS
jgi:beta-phosphoglucomutase-like phosphatase (HAD superfamily)